MEVKGNGDISMGFAGSPAIRLNKLNTFCLLVIEGNSAQLRAVPMSLFFTMISHVGWCALGTGAMPSESCAQAQHTYASFSPGIHTLITGVPRYRGLVDLTLGPSQLTSFHVPSSYRLLLRHMPPCSLCERRCTLKSMRKK